MAADAASMLRSRSPPEIPSSRSATPPHDTTQLYRYWAGNVSHHPTRAHLDEEHKVILYAALARDADLFVALLTNTFETTARHFWFASS